MSTHIKLMIVDDSNIIRNRIRRAQVDSKFEVVASATNGQEALHAYTSTQPDVVTMDLTMPKMDGIECIDRLTNLNPDVLILVVSALSDKATGIEALEKGARGFLLKPFSDDSLVDALNQITEHLNV